MRDVDRDVMEQTTRFTELLREDIFTDLRQ